jgi:Flp pilus assembly pilin Flp
MSEKIINFFVNEEGSTGAEHALLVALIGVAFILGATALGAAIDASLQESVDKMN